MTTYNESHRKYYLKNKDTIYRRSKKYKELYNKKYYKNKREKEAEALLAQISQKSSEDCVKPLLDDTQKDQGIIDVSEST